MFDLDFRFFQPGFNCHADGVTSLHVESKLAEADLQMVWEVVIERCVR